VHRAVKRLCSSLDLIARRHFVHYLWISCTLLSAANAAPVIIITGAALVNLANAAPVIIITGAALVALNNVQLIHK